ncbi:MAG TPA: 4a-hydroxytetrahydrobiopterin dehydratase [Polyangiaceae bacterium]|nr:4a-hydroxytetrahydrobiopterin dehydratase [Polyangiaceae bacterium]
MTQQALSREEITSRLTGLRGWQLLEGKLHKEYRFATFVECFGFMAQTALAAEAMQHHPEWFNVYNRLIVDLRTHDVDGISELDFELARRMDSYGGA